MQSHQNWKTLSSDVKRIIIFLLLILISVNVALCALSIVIQNPNPVLGILFWDILILITYGAWRLSGWFSRRM